MIQLPFVLPAIVTRASTIGSLIEHLCHLRDKARTFRQRRREFNDAFDRGDLAAVKALQSAVTKDARVLAELKEFAGSSAFLRAMLLVEIGRASCRERV